MTRNFKVLVTSFNETLSSQTLSLLKNIGTPTKQVSTEQSILTEIHSYEPNLILFDLTTPSNINLVRIIRSDYRYKHLSMIAITELNAHNIQAEGYLYGIDDFIELPLNEQLLKLKITNFMKKSRHFSSLCNVDPLTELYNRRGFTEIFTKALKKTLKITKALVVIDLDGLKNVNDHHGHTAGDEVLALFGAFLKKNINKNDLAARWGGDEFVLLLNDVNVGNAYTLLKIMMKQWQQQTSIPLAATFSAGIAMYPDDGITLESLLDTADQCLYQNKKLKQPLEKSFETSYV